MTRREMFEKALARCERLRSRYPHDQAIVSIIAQVEYLRDLEEGVRDDRHRLEDIIIGILAVREIEVLDPLLAELLYEVEEEVEKMKVRGPSLDNE